MDSTDALDAMETACSHALAIAWLHQQAAKEAEASRRHGEWHRRREDYYRGYAHALRDVLATTRGQKSWQDILGQLAEVMARQAR